MLDRARAMLKMFAAKTNLVSGGNWRRNRGRVTAPFGTGGSFFIHSDVARLAQRLEWFASNNGVDGTENSLYYYARIIVSTNTLAENFIRVMRNRVISSEAERPCFPGLMDEELAMEIGKRWVDYYTGDFGGPGVSGVEFERRALRGWLVDGEVFVTWNSNGELQALGPDLIDHVRLDKYGKVIGVKFTGEGNARSLKQVLIIANRPSPYSVRGQTFFSVVLPKMVLLHEAEMSDAGGVSVMKKVAMIIQSPANEFANAGAGADSLMDSSDVDEGAIENKENIRYSTRKFVIERQTIIQAQPGEEFSRPSTGDTHADFNTFTTRMREDIALGLGLSPSLLTGDYHRHNFASLKVAAVVDKDYLTARRLDWNREFREPIFKRWLRNLAMMEPTLGTRIAMNMEALASPKWHWPMPISVEPLKDINEAKMKAELGLLNLNDYAMTYGINRKDALEANGFAPAEQNNPPAKAGEKA